MRKFSKSALALLMTLLMLALGISSVFAATSTKSGWVKENDEYKYYVNGTAVTGLQNIGGYPYVFDSNGTYLYPYDGHSGIGTKGTMDTAAYRNALNGKNVLTAITVNPSSSQIKIGSGSYTALNSSLLGTFSNATIREGTSSNPYLQLPTKSGVTYGIVERNSSNYAIQLNDGYADGYINVNLAGSIAHNSYVGGSDVVFEAEYGLAENFDGKKNTSLLGVIYRNFEITESSPESSPYIPSLLRLSPDGYVYTNQTGTGEYLAKLTSNELTRISVALHMQTNTYDVYVNGIRVVSDLLLADGYDEFIKSAKINEFRMFQFTTSDELEGGVLADNVYCYVASEPVLSDKGNYSSETSSFTSEVANREIFAEIRINPADSTVSGSAVAAQTLSATAEILGKTGKLQIVKKSDGVTKLVTRGNGLAASITDSTATSSGDCYFNVYPAASGIGKELVFDAEISLGADYNHEAAAADLNIVQFIYRKSTTGADEFVQLLKMKKDGTVYTSIGKVELFKLTDAFTRVSVALHPDSNSYDVYANGKLVAASISFHSDPSFASNNELDEVRSLRFENKAGCDGSAIIDNVYLYSGSTPVYLSKMGMYEEGAYIRHYRNNLIQTTAQSLTGTYFGKTFNGESVSFAVGHAFVGARLSVKVDGKVTSSAPVTSPLTEMPAAVDMKNGRTFVAWKATSDDGKVIAVNANEELMITSDTLIEAVGISLEMLDGASVSTNGTPTLRFMAKLSASDYAALKELGLTVTPHILIAPSSCYDNTYGYHTLEALQKAGYTSSDYKDIAVSDWFSQSSAYYYFAGSTDVIDLSDADKDFSAVAYLEITNQNGEKGILYSGFSDEANTRALYEVAHAAYNDRVTTETDGYTNVIPFNGSDTYSSYTSTELAFIKTLCDKVLLLKSTDTGIVSVGAYYDSPYTISNSANGGVFTVTVSGSVSDVIAISVDGKLLSPSDYTVSSGSITFTFDSGAQKIYATGAAKSFSKIGSAAVFANGGFGGLINNVFYASNPYDKNTKTFKDGDIYYIPANVFAVANDRNAVFYTGLKLLEFTYGGEVYKLSETVATAGGTPITLKHPVKASGGAVYISTEDAMSIFGYTQCYTDVTGIIVLSNTANILNIDTDYSAIIEKAVNTCIYVRPTGQQIADDVMSFSGAQHPYLMMTQKDFDDLNFYQKTSPLYQKYIANLETNNGPASSKFTRAPENYNITDGQRLLSISRNVVNKILPWATLYHLYADENTALANQYAERIWDELEAVYYFKDWNPSHYLDTGEMAYAVAIGYDWLYNYWNDTQRAMLESMLYGMALKTTTTLGGTYNLSSATNNWNGVTNGGIMAAALALVNVQNDITWKKVDNTTPYQGTKVFSSKPQHGETAFTVNELLDANGTAAPTYADVTKYTTKASDVRADVIKVLETSITAIEKGMWVYGPDGGYEEGPGYWSYGTTYTHVFIASLDTACGTSYGIYETIGFAHSVYFTTYLGSNNSTWGFHDGGSGSADTNIAAWFARKSGDGNINTIRRQAIEEGWKSMSFYDVLYFNPHIANNSVSLDKDAYYSLDAIMTFRDSWDAKSNIFAGLHGGDNAASHGDLDIGNFVISANGVYLIDELNAEAYMVDGYFGNYRWNYYRKRAEGQNTLVMRPTGTSWNNTTGNSQTGKKATADQISTAVSKTIRYESGINSAIGVVDMSPAYTYMTSGIRGMYFTDNRSTIIVQDEAVFSQAMDIWWFAHTKGKITVINGGKAAIIERNGLTLYAEIVSTDHSGAVFTTMSADSLDANYVGDTIPNPTYPNGGYEEYDRSAYSKLCIKLTNVSSIKLAVAFKVIGGASATPELGTTYAWTDIANWSTESAHNCAENLHYTPANSSNCLNEGNSAYYQCTLCDKYYSDSEAKNEITENSWILEKTAHTPSATGTSIDSETHSSSCAICNTPLKAEKHTYQYICSTSCSKCDYERFQGSPLAHVPTGTLSYNDSDPLFGNYHYDLCTFCGIKLDPVEHVMSDYISNGDATLYTDGTKTATCTAGCGKSVTVADVGSAITSDLVFSGMALTLYDDVAANYRVHKSVFESGKYSDIYAKFILGSKAAVIVTDYTVMGDYYVFRFSDIPAYCMTDTITATLCATYESQAVEGVATAKSVRDYCRAILAQSGISNELKNLIYDVMNYGAASQQYAGYNTTIINLANFGQPNSVTLRPNNIDLNALTNASNVTEFAGATVNFSGVSISTGNQIRFSIDATDVTGLSVKVVGVHGSTTITDFDYDEELGKYVFYFCDITAAQMKEVFSFTIYRDGAQASGTLTYSVESYAAGSAASTDTKLVKLLKSMILYGESAKAYADTLK